MLVYLFRFLPRSAPALPGRRDASLAWGDYDNDGDLDMLLGESGIARIYRNDGDGAFTYVNAGLPPATAAPDP